ncbi:MAG TPA: ABC transporter ATP-binding protein [Mycobacteriales bacterium]
MSVLPIASPAAVRRRALGLLAGHRALVGAALLVQVFAAAAGLVGPAVLGHLVDVVVHGGARDEVNRDALLFGAALVAQALLTWLGTALSAVAGEAALAELREEFVHRVLDLPLATVEDTDAGDLLARASSDVKTLQDEVRQVVPVLAVAALQIVFFAAGLVIAAPLLALALPLGLVPLAVSTVWYRRRAPAASREILAAAAATGGHVVETVDAGRTVAALRLGPQRLREAEAAIRRTVRAEWEALRLRLVWFPSAELSYGLPLVGVLLGGGWLALRGHLSLGALTAAALYVRLLVEPVDTLVSWLDELQIGSAAMARLQGITDVPRPASAAGAPSGGDVVADDVRFAYRPGHDVLAGLSLRVRSGQRVAVVGPSGAGKSTLARLLAGIASPRAGRLLVGGAAVGTLAPEVVREHVALVTQEQHVFVGTLRDNLLIARPAATDADVWDALTGTGARAWVEGLPHGLDTRVGSGAHPVSPGQAQQLALARLLLADPDVLVLDEATALLDPGAARDLEQSLAAVLHGRTVVAIAHRLSTAFDADLVAVVESGRVRDLGTHEELLRAGGPYAELWQSWQDDRDDPVESPSGATNRPGAPGRPSTAHGAPA